jgi:hypothetical protein
MSASVTNAETFSYIGSWGSGRGSGEGQLYNPSSVAVDSSGNFYVYDTSNQHFALGHKCRIYLPNSL